MQPVFWVLIPLAFFSLRRQQGAGAVRWTSGISVVWEARLPGVGSGRRELVQSFTHNRGHLLPLLGYVPLSI